MEDLIRQAFLNVDVLGEQVQEGRYDLYGPDGEIILPKIWESTVQAGWAISMQMWQNPEPPPPPPPMHMHMTPEMMQGHGPKMSSGDMARKLKEGKRGKSKAPRPASMVDMMGPPPPGAGPLPPPMHHAPMMPGAAGMPEGVEPMPSGGKHSKSAKGKRRSSSAAPSGLQLWLSGGGVNRGRRNGNR